MDSKQVQDSNGNFPPVVSVLGHVDHGKTSLLDKIRSTSAASREKGGITQKIGASQIEIKHEGLQPGEASGPEGKVRRITFIDTPGHEAFANMRSQGVNAADVVLLIVAADDGVMPQTRESILKILEAKLPFIVVFTKIDVETASLDRAKQSVVKEGILLEGLGGDTPFIGVSSKTGENIEALLDLIVLVYDLSGLKKDETKGFSGVMIDAKQDKRRGIVSSVVIKEGKISVGDVLFTHGKQVGKIRAITDTVGKNVKTASPGEAVELLGMTEVLPAGSVLFDREVELIIAPVLAVTTPVDMMAFLKDAPPDIIRIILKTEASAEMEALKNALPKNTKIIFEGQGEIGVSDILMGKDFHALVLGFNVDINREAKPLADSEKVFYKSYNIIYQMLDEIEQLTLAINTEAQEKILGKAQILASFMGTTGAIIGLKVTEGRLAIGDNIRIMRAEREMGNSKISSIKHGKEDVKLAEKGAEYGVSLVGEVDFAPQDVIIAYSKKGA